MCQLTAIKSTRQEITPLHRTIMNDVDFLFGFFAVKVRAGYETVQKVSQPTWLGNGVREATYKASII